MSCAGAKYKNDCPLEDKIPIYLIVAGSVGVFRNLISLGQRSRSSNNDDDSDKRRNPCSSVLDTFLFIWFICGNVWIYRHYEPNNYTDPDAAGYCNKTLYLFAFWVTTTTYIMMGVLCCCVCCAAMCAAMFSD